MRTHAWFLHVTFVKMATMEGIANDLIEDVAVV
jgi:hypothetical protein